MNNIAFSRFSVSFAVFALTFSSSIVNAESRSPYRTSIQGVSRLDRLEKGESTILSVQTIEGMAQIRLKRTSKGAPPQFHFSGGRMLPSAPLPEVRLFKGTVKSRRNRQNRTVAASAALVGSTLRVFIPGSRKRLFAVSASAKDLKSNGTREGVVTFTRTYRNLPCLDSIAIPANLNRTTDPATQITLPTTALLASQQVDVATYADSNYIASRGDDTNAYILSIMNQIDSLYTNQLDISVNVPAQVLVTSSSTLTSLDAEVLLQQFGSYVINQGLLNSADLHHLFTGKNVSFEGNSNVAGLAYQGVLCESPQASFGLSENVSLALATVIGAHEIGHNFNADHDSASGFIMSATSTSTATEFSPSSINQILDWVSDNGSCLAATGPAVNLSVAVTRRNKMRLTVTSTNTSSLDCSIQIFGAARRSTVQDTPGSGVSIAALDAVTDGVAQRITSRPLTRIAKTSTFYRAVMTCGSDEFNSEVITLSADEGNNLRSVPDARFFNHLGQKLN